MFFYDIEQRFDFSSGGKIVKYEDIQNKCSSNRQGGVNVHNVIESFLQTCIDLNYINKKLKKNF